MLIFLAMRGFGNLTRAQIGLAPFFLTTSHSLDGLFRKLTITYKRKNGSSDES